MSTFTRKQFIEDQTKRGVTKDLGDDYYTRPAMKGSNLTNADIDYAMYLQSDVDSQSYKFSGSDSNKDYKAFAVDDSVESPLEKSTKTLFELSDDNYSRWKSFSSFAKQLKDYNKSGMGEFKITGRTKHGKDYNFNLLKTADGTTTLNGDFITSQQFDKILSNNLNQYEDLVSRMNDIENMDVFDARSSLSFFRDKGSAEVGEMTPVDKKEPSFFNKIFGKQY